jgi:membrane-associated phospholipid phosphatase
MDRRGWLLAEGMRRTWRRFVDDLRTVPDPARRRFAWTLTGGLAVALAVMLGLCWLARGMEAAGRLDWEHAALERVGTAGPMDFSTALWAESPGNSVFMIPVVLMAALLCAWRAMPIRSLAVLASFFMVDLVVLLGWLVWNRDRPVAIEGGIASPGFHSFPSGHVAQMVAVYGLFVYLWARASGSWLERLFAVILLVAVVVVVALSRLRLGAHWPSDVIAGAIVGALWLAVVVIALRRAEALGGR